MADVAGLIIKNYTAIRSYGGSEYSLRLLTLKAVTGFVNFEVLSKKTDAGAQPAKSECSLLFINGILAVGISTNVHGLCYHSDGNKISIYGMHNNLQYAYLTISVKGGMEYVQSISASDSMSLPSGVISI